MDIVHLYIFGPLLMVVHIYEILITFLIPNLLVIFIGTILDEILKASINEISPLYSSEKFLGQ